MKILHQVWVQGEDELPEAYQENRKKWKEALPDDWEMILWDDQMARDRWPIYNEVSDLCSHHAMRCDIILALALRDIGGVTTGTDVIPRNLQGFLDFISVADTMVLINPKDHSCSNGLVWMKETNNPMIQCLCKHQIRNRARLKDKNVWAVTGPRAWWEAAVARRWSLHFVADSVAYTRMWKDRDDTNIDGWVDPGYAASWH